MDEIKVSLSITLPGSVMFSKEECLKTTQEFVTKISKSGNTYTRSIERKDEDWSKMEKYSLKVTETNGLNPETIIFRTRKCKPATQSINMSSEAYDYMISKHSCPSWLSPSKWLKMSREQRLEAHLQRITESLGGLSFTYQVFED